MVRFADAIADEQPTATRKVQLSGGQTMTRDDIIRMAREAGFVLHAYPDENWLKLMERFAALIAAEKDKEIERLRKVLKKLEYFSDGTIRRYPTESEVEAARQEQPK
jgi:hypothetical protein